MVGADIRQGRAKGAGHGRAGQRARQGKGQGRAGQGRAGQGRAGQGAGHGARQGRAGQGTWHGQEAGQGRALGTDKRQGRAGHLAGDEDSHLAEMKTKGVEQAVQHHEEEEKYEHTQIVHWHHSLICDV